MERTEAVQALARSTFTLVNDAQRGMSRAFDAPRVGVLRVVAGGTLRPSAISERLDMAPSSVTRHIQALEDAGHVEVEADPADARTCLVSATAAGLAELEQLEAVGLAAFEHVVRGWSLHDLRTLARLLTRLTNDWAENGPAARPRSRSAGTPRWRFRPMPDEKRES